MTKISELLFSCMYIIILESVSFKFNYYNNRGVFEFLSPYRARSPDDGYILVVIVGKLSYYVNKTTHYTLHVHCIR